MLSRADDIEGVRIAVDGISDYKSYFEATGMGQGSSGAGNMSGGTGSDGKSLEDMFYQKEMEISKNAFTRQFSYAIVYAWVKLREQVCSDQVQDQRSLLTPSLGNQKHHLDC
jgi:V-type H+-transporting ATPase subunit d